MELSVICDVTLMYHSVDDIQSILRSSDTRYTTPNIVFDELILPEAKLLNNSLRHGEAYQWTVSSLAQVVACITTRTNVDLLSEENRTIFIQEIALENVIYKLETTLFRPLYIDSPEAWKNNFSLKRFVSVIYICVCMCVRACVCVRERMCVQAT